jgi:hypothetical protein
MSACTSTPPTSARDNCNHQILCLLLVSPHYLLTYLLTCCCWLTIKTQLTRIKPPHTHHELLQQQSLQYYTSSTRQQIKVQYMRKPLAVYPFTLAPRLPHDGKNINCDCVARCCFCSRSCHIFIQTSSLTFRKIEWSYVDDECISNDFSKFLMREKVKKSTVCDYLRLYNLIYFCLATSFQ